MDEKEIYRLEELLTKCESRLNEDLRFECCKLALKSCVSPIDPSMLTERADEIYQYMKKGKDNH